MELIEQLKAGGYNVRVMNGRVVATRGANATLPIAAGQRLMLRLQREDMQRAALAVLQPVAQAAAPVAAAALSAPAAMAHAAQKYIDRCEAAMRVIEKEPASALSDARWELWFWKRELIAGGTYTAGGERVSDHYYNAVARVSAMKSIDEAEAQHAKVQ